MKFQPQNQLCSLGFPWALLPLGNPFLLWVLCSMSLHLLPTSTHLTLAIHSDSFFYVFPESHAVWYTETSQWQMSVLSLFSLHHHRFRKLRCYNRTRKRLLLFLPSNEYQPVFWSGLVKVTLTPHLQSGESQGYFYKITEEGPFPLNLVACKQVPWLSSLCCHSLCLLLWQTHSEHDTETLASKRSDIWNLF